jgi:tRNA G18 (ribose-2'-O)-methylase SpoU
MIRKLSHEEIKESKPSPEKVLKIPRTPMVVVFDNIRSLYNVGAMFRTSDGVLAEKIFLCGITGQPPRKEIDKVALGAAEVVPWEYCQSSYETVLKLKENGLKIYALELTAQSKDFKEVNYQFPMAVILGNEVDGITDDVMSLVDEAISIKMLGRANSLNVATAYGIVAYEVLHQYQNAKK